LLKQFTLKMFVLPVMSAALVVAPALAGDQHSTEGAERGVSLENAWVRAMPPTQHNTAGYLIFRNNGEKTVRIVGASSTPAAQVEMHNSRLKEGMMTMERVEIVEVAPGKSVEFAPGGMHLMIMGLDTMPAPGEQLRLCLELESMAPVCTAAPVRKVALSPDDSMHNHKHH